MMSGPKKVALFTPNLVGGGAELFAVKLAQGLLGHGLAVDVVAGQATGTHAQRMPAGVRLVDLHTPHMRDCVIPLARYLSKEKPHSVVSSQTHANIAAIWAGRLAGGTAPIFVVNHIHLTSLLTHGRGLRNWLTRFLVRVSYPRAAGVLSVSQTAAVDLARVSGLPAERIHTMPIPVIEPDFQALAAQPVDHPWLVERQVPVVVAVGGLRVQKDFATLLRAFALVKERRDARLIIVGEGTERVALSRLVTQLGLENHVSLPGWVPCVYPYISRAAAFALSSRWEGFPAVLIEALACGVPIVSTDCPSGPREVLAEGKHGRLVPLGDPLALAEGLTAALGGEVARPSRESWEPFAVGAAAAAYVRVLFAEPWASTEGTEHGTVCGGR
jgi:glycosyltransferase involved in cell wall biosynthesis